MWPGCSTYNISDMHVQNKRNGIMYISRSEAVLSQYINCVYNALEGRFCYSQYLVIIMIVHNILYFRYVIECYCFEINVIFISIKLCS